MAKLKRIALGLLVAYAASMTLYASHKSAEAMLFRRIYGRSPHINACSGSEGYPLVMIAKDYGADLTPMEFWALRIVDIQWAIMMPAIVLFFLLGLGIALFHPLSRFKLDKD